MSKTEDVMQKLSEGLSTKEIMEETGCSKGLISQCRKKIADKANEEEVTDNDLVPDEELEEAHNSFVKRVKIKPDPEPVKKEKKTFYVACDACKGEWEVESDERISTCPYCGVDLS